MRLDTKLPQFAADPRKITFPDQNFALDIVLPIPAPKVRLSPAVVGHNHAQNAQLRRGCAVWR